MEEKKITVDAGDFDLHKEYDVFDVIYTTPVSFKDHEIKAWTVIGHQLRPAANHRNFETLLCSYPISVFVMQNTFETLATFQSASYFISRNREELVAAKRAYVKSKFDEFLSDIK